MTMSLISKMLPVYDFDIEEKVLLCEERNTYLFVLCDEENLVRIQNTQIHGCVHLVQMRNVLIMEVHRLQAAPAGFAKGKVATHVL